MSWLRELLGEDPEPSTRHPVRLATFGGRILGVPVEDRSGHLTPGLGYPNGCRFCSTSHFFGRRYIAYVETGRELFDLCVAIEKDLNVRMCDTYLRGYRTLAAARESLLKARREAIKRCAVKFRPFLATARDHAHNERSRELVDRVTAEYREAFGPMTLWERALSQVVRAYATREARRVASGRNVYYPPTLVTRYHM